MNEPAPFVRRADGVYVGDDKVAHIVDPGGHVRMAAGKSDLRDEVMAFLKDDPAIVHHEAPSQSAPAAEQQAPASSAPAAAGDITNPFDEPEPAVPVVAPAPAAPANPAPRQTAPAPARPTKTPTPQTTPPRPESPIGDKDPLVIHWYRTFHPERFTAKYGGTKWESIYPEG